MRKPKLINVEFAMLLMLIGAPLAYAALRLVFALARLAFSR